MSNPSQSQKRSLQPTVSTPTPGAYSASPSQLTLPSDGSAAAGFHNPYHTSYNYAPSSHNPTGFAFPPQPHYAPHGLPGQHQTLPHHQQQQQQQQQQQPSPTNSRKRRASELGGDVQPVSASSNASAFTNPTGLVAGSADMDLGLGASQVQLPSPTVAKKGRTNTPWTPAEEQRLKTLREAGSSWSEIAKTFPTRTEGSVKKHWYKDMHYAEFAEDESAALLQAIKDYENNKWKVIGQKLGKPAKACEQFAKEQGWKV
jgi:hypothetical protein